MNPLFLSKRLWLPLLLLAPLPLHATGFGEPARWLVENGRPMVLEAPEFYFELEVKRIAAELPNARKTPAPAKKLSQKQQNAQADEVEFADAIATKRIAPPDVEAAKEAQRQMRKLIDTPTPEDGKRPPPAEFPSEFADYHRGALHLKQGAEEEMQKDWEALLARPAAERHYRTVWALYMFGTLAIDEKHWEEARGWFGKVRAAAAEGFADSLNLATASCGWEAFAWLQEEKYAEAARLYFAQLAGGDMSAVGSLKVVLGEIFKDDADLDALAADPALQRLGTAAAVARMGQFQYSSDPPDPKDLGLRWLAALEKLNVKKVRDAERLAWTAYAAGHFKTAARWLARANPEEPYALWLRAKLALREGRIAEAAPLLGKAVAGIPTSPPLFSRHLEGDETPPDRSVKNDFAAVQLGRGEFLQAFRIFIESDQIHDAEYLADHVLTIDELKAIVKRDYPEKAKPAAPPEVPETPAPATAREPADDDSEDFNSPWPTSDENFPRTFRGILASRLIRLGRSAEARPYLREEAREKLDQYNAHLEAAKKPGIGKAERSAALWEAANLMRDAGGELVDYSDPIVATARLNRREIVDEDSSVFALNLGKGVKIFPAVTKAEEDRLRANSKPALRRNYSRYVAADLGWQAAALLPDNEESTAIMLNTAGSWLKIGDEKAADRFYQAIERRCPKTALGKKAIKRHWFVPKDEVE